jgi:hypothetical protein
MEGINGNGNGNTREGSAYYNTKVEVLVQASKP